MKKLLLILLSINLISVLGIASANAATPSPTKSASSKTTTTPPAPSVTAEEEKAGEKINDQINQLKDRIASRVAELNLVEKRGVIGTVSETSGNQVTFTDMSGNKRYIDVDEITNFSSPSARASFGLSDLVRGTKISVLGLYNKQSQRILARFIEGYVTPTFISGRISDVDKKNFTITIADGEKKQTKVDVVTATVISIYFKEDGISKYGFSKLSPGDRVMVTGFWDKNDSTLLAGSRILVLPELPENPNIVISEPKEEISATPSVKVSVTPARTVLKTPTPTK